MPLLLVCSAHSIGLAAYYRLAVDRIEPLVLYLLSFVEILVQSSYILLSQSQREIAWIWDSHITILPLDCDAPSSVFTCNVCEQHAQLNLSAANCILNTHNVQSNFVQRCSQIQMKHWINAFQGLQFHRNKYEAVIDFLCAVQMSCPKLHLYNDAAALPKHWMCYHLPHWNPAFFPPASIAVVITHHTGCLTVLSTGWILQRE